MAACHALELTQREDSTALEGRVNQKGETDVDIITLYKQSLTWGRLCSILLNRRQSNHASGAVCLHSGGGDKGPWNKELDANDHKSTTFKGPHIYIKRQGGTKDGIRMTFGVVQDMKRARAKTGRYAYGE